MVKLVSGHDVHLSERYVVLERIGLAFPLRCFVLGQVRRTPRCRQIGQKRWDSGVTSVARMRAERELAILRRCSEAELNENTGAIHTLYVCLRAWN